MLLKILFTLLIICGASWFLSERRIKDGNLKRKNVAQSFVKKHYSKMIMLIIVIVVMSIASWRWWSANQIMQVTILSPIDGQSVSYLVKKKNLKPHQLITIHGLDIRLSNQDRIIIRHD